MRIDRTITGWKERVCRDITSRWWGKCTGVLCSTNMKIGRLEATLHKICFGKDHRFCLQLRSVTQSWGLGSDQPQINGHTRWLILIQKSLAQASLRVDWAIRHTEIRRSHAVTVPAFVTWISASTWFSLSFATRMRIGPRIASSQVTARKVGACWCLHQRTELAVGSIVVTLS